MNALLLSPGLSPCPELNPHACNQPSDASLIPPFVRFLRDQAPENLILLLDVV
jgi:hypothetical protein